MTESYATILNKAVGVVRRAGEKTKATLHQGRIFREKNHGDIVTDMDLLVNDMITSDLMDMFPQFGLISEEGGSSNIDREFVWVLDPIDGTKHFRIGNPFYGISLALQRKRETCLSIVYFPSMNELFTAIKGQGAFLNEKQIHARPTMNLLDAILCVEIPSRNDDPEKLSRGLERLKMIIENCLRIRVVGLTSLNLLLCGQQV